MTAVDGDPLEERARAAADLLEAGRVDEAMTSYGHLVSDMTRMLGPTHVRTVESRLGLGRACLAAEDHERAVVLFESVASYKESGLGAGHPEAIEVRRLIAESLAASGRTSEATESLAVTTRVAAQHLGTDHEVTTTLRTRLADLQSAG
jgi:hypothetical protein